MLEVVSGLGDMNITCLFTALTLKSEYNDKKKYEGRDQILSLERFKMFLNNHLF